MKKIKYGSVAWKLTKQSAGAIVECEGKTYTVDQHTKYSVLAKDEQGKLVTLDPRKVYANY